MTGFARVEGVEGATAWSWEAKSVNGKGLDVRCRVPPGSEDMDIEARNLAAKKFQRGNITLGLSLRRGDGEISYRVNEEFLDRLVGVVRGLEDRFGGQAEGSAPPRLDGLLSVRGVIEAVEEDDDAAAGKRLKDTVMSGLVSTLDALTAMRESEGRALADVLDGLLSELTAHYAKANDLAATQPAALRERLAKQVAELLEDVAAIPEERLAQEAAVLMTKADVREELDRLGAHLDAARGLLAGGGVIGRKLDFLCQEINRETNTICSKSADINLTNVGLELKAAIARFREQVQNIE